MIHYHGTPITPRSVLETLAGEHFCISYFEPRDLKTCLKIGQSLMLDNGAFSCKTRGVPFDLRGFYDWIDPILAHPHWGVVPDVIDGTIEQQREMTATWPFPKSFGIPVWHRRCCWRTKYSRRRPTKIRRLRKRSFYSNLNLS